MLFLKTHRHIHVDIGEYARMLAITHSHQLIPPSISLSLFLSDAISLCVLVYIYIYVYIPTESEVI